MTGIDRKIEEQYQERVAQQDWTSWLDASLPHVDPEEEHFRFMQAVGGTRLGRAYKGVDAAGKRRIEEAAVAAFTEYQRAAADLLHQREAGRDWKGDARFSLQELAQRMIEAAVRSAYRLWQAVGKLPMTYQPTAGVADLVTMQTTAALRAAKNAAATVESRRARSLRTAV